MTRLEVFVPYLPQRVLSTNAGSRSRRDPWSVANAVGTLKGQVMDELIGREFPTFDRATAVVTLEHTFKRPKADQCRPCRELMASGDYPSWSLPADRSKPVPCCHYRSRDVGNIGGQVLKPILDALVWLELIPDDDYTHLLSVTLRIRKVATLEEEGIRLLVTGADEPSDSTNPV